jgi:exosome complex component RRP42
MAPSATQQILLSPAELSYLHTSLSLTPPIRPDARTSTQFRPLIAETDILPGTNGSARICFADGTEAIVGIKAEVEKSRPSYQAVGDLHVIEHEDDEDEETRRSEKVGAAEWGLNEWVDLTVEIPGFRDDDSMSVFLAAMLSEALLADGEFTKRLWINRRFHWKLYLDVSGNFGSFKEETDLRRDFIAFATAILPITSTVSHDTSSAPFNSITKVKIRIG